MEARKIYGKASTVAPSAESSRQDRKKGVLVIVVNNTTFTRAYTRTFREKGKAAVKLDAVILSEK
jgi:hypothetical protein